MFSRSPCCGGWAGERRPLACIRLDATPRSFGPRLRRHGAHLLHAARGAAAVEPRTMSRCRAGGAPGVRCLPLLHLGEEEADRVAPFRRIGWWTVVRGGSTWAARSMSSKPTTLRSSGMRSAQLARRAHRADGDRVAHREDGRRAAAARPRRAGRPTRRPRSRRGRRRRRRRRRARAPAAPRRPRGSRAAAGPATPVGVRRLSSRMLGRLDADDQARRGGRGRAGARRRRGAPDSSSTTTELCSGRSSESTSTIGQPGAAGSARPRDGPPTGRSRRRRRRSTGRPPAPASRAAAR